MRKIEARTPGSTPTPAADVSLFEQVYGKQPAGERTEGVTILYGADAERHIGRMTVAQAEGYAVQTQLAAKKES